MFFELKAPINPNAYKRRTAYLDAMERLGHEPHLIQVDGQGWNFEEIGFREGSRILSDQQLPSNTILCSNDRLAIGLLSGAYEKGLKVGRDPGASFRIAGHDDHPFSRYTCPSLTTVSQDYAAIAAKSVETVLSLGDSTESLKMREEKLFEGKLIMRGSA